MNCRKIQQLFLFLWGGEFLAHCFKQLCQKRTVVHILDQQHFLGTLVRTLAGCIRYQGKRSLNRLYQQAGIIVSADNFSSGLKDIFSHHGPVCDSIQIGQLLQYKIQVFFTGSHNQKPSLR